MAIGKWIGGFLGFITGGGVLGALAGFALGALFDKGLDAANTPGSTGTRNFGGGAGGFGQQGRGSGAEGYGSGFGGRQQARQRAYEGQRNSFLFSMLVLSSYVIRADGKVMHSEMEFVRNFLRTNFGSVAVSQGEDILLKLFQKQKELGNAAYRSAVDDAAREMAAHMDYAQRLQLINYLVLIARADGRVSPEEVAAIREIGACLGVTPADVDSMLNLDSGASGDSLQAAYKVLEISPDATDTEVKAAYRRMALKHHPDKVAALGEDVRKAAERKFQEINAAKEVIYKARNM